VDQRAIEDLFERNADMRLLEFRHNEPGKGAPPNKRTASGFGAESIVSSTPDVVTENAPRLRVAIAAAPAAGVIPGAVVGVAIDVFNDGTAPAPESKLLLAIPIETEFRAGTLRIDGREPQAPEQLFAQGLPIARLPGATSSKVTFQLAVLPGVNTLYLQPRLQATGVPVVGTAGISIKRGSSVMAPAETALPFYELEDDEADEVATQAAEPVMPPVLAAPPPPAAPDPLPLPLPLPVAVVAEAVIEPEPVTAPEPEVAPVIAAIVEPEVVAEPAPAPAPAPPKKTPPPAPAAKARLSAVAASEERMARFRTLGNNDISLLDRLFAAEVPGIIAHYVVISSIACTEPAAGDDTSGYGSFLRRDIELLGRALVHSRMGKAPQYRIVQGDLDALSLDWNNALPAQSFPPQRRLRRELLKSEWSAIGGLTKPAERDATLRTRIALLALAGATFDGVDRRTGEECTAALGAYRSSVLAWLVPLCVASAGADTFVIPSPPATVDAAGRRLVAVLKMAVTS
jgi:outer membrane biosynthesis protein TonB